MSNCVAVGCEMVGIAGGDEMLARITIVNHNCSILMDKFVKPKHAVVDYRTSVSGIRPYMLESGDDFMRVQEEVRKLLHGKILVGHSVDRDLQALKIEHPPQDTRDLAPYVGLRKYGRDGNQVSLKNLAKVFLGKDIQVGEHDSSEDAKATMQIYHIVRQEWEDDIRQGRSPNAN